MPVNSTLHTASSKPLLMLAEGAPEMKGLFSSGRLALLLQYYLDTVLLEWGMPGLKSCGSRSVLWV